MEKHKIYSFLGHRKIENIDVLKRKLFQIVKRLILDCNVRVFLFGSRSDFNTLCHCVVTTLKKKYPDIKKIIFTCKSESCILESDRQHWEQIFSRIHTQDVHFLAFDEEFEHKTKYAAGKARYVERNQSMIQNSDYCIFYYNENYLPPKRQYTKNSNGTYQPNSGTAIAYAYAKQKEKHIINLFQKE